MEPLRVGLAERAEHLNDGVRIRPPVALNEDAREVAGQRVGAKPRAVVLEGVVVAEGHSAGAVLAATLDRELLVSAKPGTRNHDRQGPLWPHVGHVLNDARSD